MARAQDITGQVYLLIEKMKAYGDGQGPKRALKMQGVQEGKKFWTYYAGKIFHDRTRANYYGIAKNFARACQARYGIQYVYQMTPAMMRDYIRERLERLAPGTLRVYMSGITKLAEAVGKGESFHRMAATLSKQLPKSAPARPAVTLEQAVRVLQELARRDARWGLACRVQMESGCRLVEVVRLRSPDLGGVEEREGQRVGLVQLHGKGGKERLVTISEPTYRQLEQSFAPGVALVKYDSYRKGFHRAAKTCGLKSGGTHTLRRFSIRQFYSDGHRELRARGLTSWEASEAMRREAAQRLGHVRPEITQIYLRKA